MTDKQMKIVLGFVAGAAGWLAAVWTIQEALAVGHSGSANVHTAAGVSLFAWVAGVFGGGMASNLT